MVNPPCGWAKSIEALKQKTRNQGNNDEVAEKTINL